MGLWRKKPVVVNAMKYEGGNPMHVLVWAADFGGRVEFAVEPGSLAVVTLEGKMKVNPGDWVIRGIKGEFYPCKPDIFAATYEPAPARDRGSDEGRSEG